MGSPTRSSLHPRLTTIPVPTNRDFLSPKCINPAFTCLCLREMRHLCSMLFEEVIGQRSVKESLVQMIHQNRLSHALLFLGKEGVGGLPLARAFAQYIVCEKVNRKPEAPAGPSLFGDPEPKAVDAYRTDACGTCPACQKAAKGIHPDIHFSFPVIPRKSGDKPISNDYLPEWREFITQHPYGNAYDWLQFIGAENRQGNITAEECNDIIRKLSLKSFESEYKILILWMPEYLTKNGNRLLKLIEEPPAKTLFILVAEDDGAILPTILSRTQLVKIPLLHPRDVEATLELKAGIPLAKAQQIAALSEGNYREALQLAQHPDDDWMAVVREWLNLIARGQVGQWPKWIDQISKEGREKQKQFLQYFVHLLEQSVRLSQVPDAPQHFAMSETEQDFAARMIKLCSIHQLQTMVEILEPAAYYVERNANPKMLFHALSIKLFHVIRNNSVILVQ